jgi:membrane fusion protein (multidrug efflux system)
MEQADKPPDAPPEKKDDAGKSEEQSSFWTRPPVILGGSILLAVLFFFALHYVLRSFTHESTDNAFLDGDVVSVAPKVAGQIKAVHVDPNQSVNAGDLLVEIDPRDFEIQVAQKKAALTAAQANEGVIRASFELLGTQVQSAEATARQSAADAAASQATANQAAADLKRAEELYQRTAISSQEFETSKTTASAASSSAAAAKEKTASDKAKVDSARATLEAGRQAYIRAQAQSAQSDVDVRAADLNFSYTRITAPIAGRITRKAIAAGDYVQAGQQIMALVPYNVWVTANFKETQLKKIRVGQPVSVSIDSLAGKTFAAHIESIQAGSGAAFSLLPPENAVGNFVKVVQRVPVRIVFDAPLRTEHVVGPGMSVMPSVKVRNFDVPGLVVVLVAILLAAVAGWVWRKLADRRSAAK